MISSMYASDGDMGDKRISGSFKYFSNENLSQEPQGRTLPSGSRTHRQRTAPVIQVATLKNKIQEAKNLPAESLKIVFKGKTIANNEDTIEKLGIKETDFLVIMSQIAVFYRLSQKPAPKPKA